MTLCGVTAQIISFSAKFRLNLRKPLAKPARYDLNQIPNEYALEVTNRFTGLDLVNSVPEEL